MLAYEPVSLILRLTEVLSKESYYFSGVHSTTEESPWIFITAASWDILSMSWITCTLIKIPKDDKFRSCQCRAVKQLCYLSAMKADNLQCGLHTNRVIILAFFLDSCIKWKQLSTVIFCHHCFQIFNLYLTTCQTTQNRENIAPLSSSQIYLLNSSGDQDEPALHH